MIVGARMCGGRAVYRDKTKAKHLSAPPFSRPLSLSVFISILRSIFCGLYFAGYVPGKVADLPVSRCGGELLRWLVTQLPD